MRVGHALISCTFTRTWSPAFCTLPSKNVGDAELLRDLGKIFRRAFEVLRRRPRDHFQVRDLGQSRQDFVLHAFTKVSVIRIATEIIERQHRDRFVRNSSGRRRFVSRAETTQKE